MFLFSLLEGAGVLVGQTQFVADLLPDYSQLRQTEVCRTF